MIHMLEISDGRLTHDLFHPTLKPAPQQLEFFLLPDVW